MTNEEDGINDNFPDLGATPRDVAVDGDAGITIHDDGQHLPDVWLRLEIAIRRNAPGIPRDFKSFSIVIRNIIASCEECSHRSDAWETVPSLTFDELITLVMKIPYPLLHNFRL